MVFSVLAKALPMTKLSIAGAFGIQTKTGKVALESLRNDNTSGLRVQT